MGYIFLDESGDLGFDFSKNKTSKHFVITFISSSSQKPIEKIVKKVFRGFPEKVRKHHSGVLHCYKESHSARCKLLSLVVEQDIKIMTIYLDKRKVSKAPYADKHALYNYVVEVLLQEICDLETVSQDGSITLVASRRETNKFLNDQFKEHLTKNAQENLNIQLNIDIRTPAEDKCLQVADFVCWSIFRKKEMADSTYFDIIQGKIIKEVQVTL